MKTDESSPMADNSDRPRPFNSRSLKRSILSGAAVTSLALLCVLLLYSHRWLAGETIFRGVIQEQYYLLGQYAFDHRIISDFRDGYFPLWNPMNALGHPLLGNMLSGALYPLKAVIYLFPGLLVRDLYIVLRLIAAALLAFTLAKRLKLSFFPSALAALSFAFTGYFKMFVNENYLNADLLVPGMVLLALRLRDNPKIRDVILTGVLVFAVINNGHPEAAFYALFLPAFLVAAATAGGKRLARTVLLFSSAFAIGALLSLPMLLPFIEYWARGFHFHVPGTGFFHYSARQLVSLVSPWFFGPAPAGAPFLVTPEITWPKELSGVFDYSLTTVPWLFPALGAVPFFLALVSASRLKNLGRTETALLIYALFFIGVMFGLPMFRWLGLLPVFSFSGNFKHPLPGVALGGAILAGRGLEMILRGGVSGARVAAVLVSMLIGTLFLGTVYDPLPGGPPFLNRYSGTILIVLVVAGTWIVWFAAQEGGKSGLSRHPARTASGLIAGLVALAAVIACLVVDGFQQPMRDPGYEERIGAGAADKRLKEISSLDRVYLSQDIAPPNLNILFDLADLRVMDGVNDRRLVEAVNRINGHDRAQAGTYWYREVGYLQPMPDRLSHPLLKLMNVRYAIMDGPLPYNRTIHRLLSEAKVIAPGPGYVGRARLPLSDTGAPGILQHPPSRISWRPDTSSGAGEEKLSQKDSLRLRFRPAVMSEAQNRQTDGVWLMVLAGRGLSFSRYFHPKRQKGDALLPMTELKLDGETGSSAGLDLVMASLPAASPDFDQAGWADFRAGGREGFARGDWEELERGETWLYRNPGALPRVFLASRARLASDSEALELLATGGIDPRDTVLISPGEKSGEEVLAPSGRGVPGLVESYKYSAQGVRIEANLWRRGWLVIGDLYYPGWRCLVDGKPERIMRADFCLRALPLSQGSHTVLVTYKPLSFRIGLWSMISTLLCLTAGCGIGRKTAFYRLSPSLRKRDDGNC